MPTEMRFLIDVVLVLAILGWGSLYGLLQTWNKWIDEELKIKNINEGD